MPLKTLSRGSLHRHAHVRDAGSGNAAPDPIPLGVDLAAPMAHSMCEEERCPRSGNHFAGSACEAEKTHHSGFAEGAHHRKSCSHLLGIFNDRATATARGNGTGVNAVALRPDAVA